MQQMITKTVYFTRTTRTNGITANINTYETKGWTVKLMVPFLNPTHNAGSSTAGLMVAFEKDT